MRKRWVVLIPMAAVGFVIFVALGGLVVQLLWNWLLPPLFGLPTVTFWQALGLLALCRILFGGFSNGGHRRSSFRERFGRRWEKRWEERLAHMTPEEQERFREGLHERCGFRPKAAHAKES